MVLINAIIAGIHLVLNGHCFHLLESFAHLGSSWKALPPLQLGQLTLLKILLGCHPLCDICKTRRDKSSTCNLPTSTPSSTALCILPGGLFIALLSLLAFWIAEGLGTFLLHHWGYSWSPKRQFKSMSEVEATVYMQTLALSFTSCVIWGSHLTSLCRHFQIHKMMIIAAL